MTMTDFDNLTPVRFSQLPTASLPLQGDEWALIEQDGVTCRTRVNTLIVLASYTVSTLPSASVPGTLIYVTNESGGAVPAFADGTNWRRITDRAVVS